MIPRLALLGAVKHWKRSLVVVAAVAIACAVMIAVGSLLNGVTSSFFDTVIPNSGHVRVDDARAAKALNPLSLDLVIPDAEGKIGRILALKDPRVLDAEPLLSFGALVVEDTGSGDPRNTAMRGIGLRDGTRFADNIRQAMTAGAFLPGGKGIVMSEAAARLVGAALGKGVLVLVQDRSGQPWYERLEVTGLYRTESRDFDETSLYISLDKAQEMLDVAGSAREIRLLLRGRDDAGDVSREASAALGAGSGPPLRVLPWQTINASVVTLLIFINTLLGIIMALFAVVAGTIIANTSLMSVMERLREFGTMRAIGLRAKALERLILLEGLMLGAAGAAIGVALGSVVVALLQQGGLDLGGMMDSLGLKRYNRPRPDLLWYLACTAASLFVSLAATAKAARTVASLGVADSIANAA